MHRSPKEPMPAFKKRLATSSDLAFALYAGTAAFCTYFCMYAFRKPFAAGTYEGLQFFGTEIDLKTAFALSQLIGYTLSKYMGVKINSERVGAGRARLLVQLILAALCALLLFAILPTQWKWIAIFCNGLPLGMVWGLVVSFLEGRRTSDVLMAGLCCSFILASGVVKDVGRWLMNAQDVPEFWMPFATGLIFLPGFFLSVWLLKQLPGPTPEDIEERSQRSAMDKTARWAFFKQFAGGLILLLLAYTALSAFREFRDVYQADLFRDLYAGTGVNWEDEKALFTRSEMWVAFGVMAAMAMLYVIKDNRKGFFAATWLMAFGFALIGLSTWALDAGHIQGMNWMIGTGLGAYLAYVPFNAVLFERMMAYTRFTGTAVFAIYLADSSGYTGAVGLQLYKDLVAGEASRLVFFKELCYTISVLGTLLVVLSAIYFSRKSTATEPEATDLM
jgi:hypothetical protein